MRVGDSDGRLGCEMFELQGSFYDADVLGSCEIVRRAPAARAFEKLKSFAIQ